MKTNDSMKHNNIHVLRFPEEEEREKVTESFLEQIVDGYFPRNGGTHFRQNMTYHGRTDKYKRKVIFRKHLVKNRPEPTRVGT